MRRTLNKTYNHGITVLREASESPTMLAREFNRVYHRRFNMRQYNTAGTDVLTQDWDNLIILDACRYDLFTEVNTIEDDLQKTYSTASNTGEFFQRELTEEYPDTVYLTANPNFQLDDERRFHQVICLWEDDWDEDLNTVPPVNITEKTLETVNEYPDKRLVIHFVQPHRPFIGETGRETSGQYDQNTLWQCLNDGSIEIDDEFLWKAYRENLQLALPHVEQLIDELDGKTVITSDHGNAFAEYGMYGHPAQFHIPPLITVPWLTTPYDNRKTITKGELENDPAEIDSGAISERLAGLGYLE